MNYFYTLTHAPFYFQNDNNVKKVAVVSGGGSGHEPFSAGLSDC